jgi:creatinine amidohydrolase
MRNPGLISLSDITTAEARQVWKDVRCGLLPTGATEQHGPNLEMSCDITVATAFAERLARAFHPRVALLPPFPYGVSPHHMAFTGTLTLRPETFDAVVCDLADSLLRHGVKKLLVVNGHGGNQAPLALTLAKLRDRGVQAASLAWFSLAADECAKTAKHTPYNHACEVETSVALALAPQIVRKDQLAAGKVKPSPYRNANPSGSAKIDVPWKFDELSENGALGDARLATREDGERIVAATLDRASAFLEDFLKA